MKKTSFSLLTTACVLMLTGCLPEAFVWWSPNGQTAAIRTPEGLRLAGTNGQLSDLVLSGEIQSAAWLPDGTGLVVSRARLVTNWAEAEALVPTAEAAATKRIARGIPDLLKAGLTVGGGSLSNLDKEFLQPLGMTESRALEPAWFCALSLHRTEILKVLAGFTNAAALEAELLSSATNNLAIHEISLLPIRNGRPSGQARSVVRSLHYLLDPVLSAQHSILAFRTEEGILRAMTLDGKTSLDVAEGEVVSAAWSADGRALLYITRGKTDRVGEIRYRSVVTGSGELLRDRPAETLAMFTSVAETPSPLAVLPDGRVLFSSMPITLPARVPAINPVANFYLLDPAWRGEPPMAVEIKEGSLPSDLSSFAVSPDGHFVAVVEGGSDAVAILELATGKVQIVSPAHAGWKSRMLPAWRNARELSFAALASAQGKRPELNLWQANTPTRLLSTNWPDSMVKPWLEGSPQKER